MAGRSGWRLLWKTKEKGVDPNIMDNAFRYQDGELFCEGVAVRDIARQVGTPFYLYSSFAFCSRLNDYEKAFGNYPHLVCFAVKSNSNLAVLNLMANQGAGADIVSGGELFRALRSGFPADRIVYSGVGKTIPEIREAIGAGILMFNVESMQELEEISRQARILGKRARISFRVNPDVNPKTHPYISTGLKKNKFGMPMGMALEAYRMAMDMDGIDIIGIDCHIGSQLTDLAPFVDALDRVKSLLVDIESFGIELDYIDIGGGLGIKYHEENAPSPGEYVRAILDHMDGLEHKIIIEPGRSIAGNAGILVTSVINIKDTGTKKFIIVDAAMNDLARPSLYEAYHAIHPVSRGDAVHEAVDIVGPICESGDFLARNRLFPRIARGDLLSVFSAGAYGFTMSSNYNSRPRAAEVLVRGQEFAVVRARETYDDLIRGEKVLDWTCERL